MATSQQIQNKQTSNQWSLLSKVISDCIVVPESTTTDNLIRAFQSCNADLSSISAGVRGYSLKAGTLNEVAQTILDIRTGKITSPSQITIGGGGGGNADTNTSSTGPSDTTEHNGPLNSTISRVPITDPKEALEWAKTEWNKIRRTSGHSIECQVFGSNQWVVGEWCKIYLPTLNEYIDMYVTKVDHSNDSGSEWLTSLTLTDYPPSLSTVDEEKVKQASDPTDEDADASAQDGSGEAGEDSSSKWTGIANILQKYYEKPSDGWDNRIRTILEAKVYDPDIKNVINQLTKKQEYKNTTHVDIGHELCEVVGIGF